MKLFRKNRKADNNKRLSNGHDDESSAQLVAPATDEAESATEDPSEKDHEAAFQVASDQESTDKNEKPKKSGIFHFFRKKKQTDDDSTETEEDIVEGDIRAKEPPESLLPEKDDPSAETETGPEEKKTGFFKRLRNRLTKTRQAFASRLDNLVLGKKEIDEDLLDELEEILITSDIGVHTSLALIDEVRKQVARKDLSNPDELKDALHNKILAFLKVPAAIEAGSLTKPHVIMVVGVNGVGKTTTIGKLASRFVSEGKRVLLVAGDTFRAAAVEQLEIWAERIGADIVRHKGKADPAAVAFDGIQAAISRDVDVAIIDTAGRLHTKVNLMEELKKIQRTVGKQLPEAPHETLLVLDATTGQNAISQAELFHEAMHISGIILTKLDGTAKGGVVAGICHKLGIPLQYIGIGEKIEDLQPFDPDAFMQALF